MNFTNGVFAVEYARGPIPMSIPFGLSDVLVSTVDFKTAIQTLSLYGDLVCQHYGRTLGSLPVVGPVAQVATHLVSNVMRRVTDKMVAPGTLLEMPPDNPPGW